MLRTKHEIEITSENYNKIEDYDLIEAACHFFLNELEKSESIQPIKLDIHILDMIKSDETGEIVSGDVTKIKDGEYLCRLSSYINSVETIMTIAHEITHIWQFCCGKLEITDDGWYWKKKSYGKIPYLEKKRLPWETEANKNEKKLSKKFFSKYIRKIK